MDKNLTILLVDDEENECKRFSRYADLTDELSIVAVTDSSVQALQLLKEYLPDVVILELELNRGQGNGLSFLQKMQELSLPFHPYILITTNNSSKITYDHARQLGADFIMSKHQENYSEENALDFLRMLKNTIQGTRKEHYPESVFVESDDQYQKRLFRRIHRELDQIGISPKVMGYQYLTNAIFLVITGQNSNLCSTIGQKFHKTDSSVERAMQNAINKAWRTSDIDELTKHYTARIRSEKGVPTMTEFIYHYATKLKNEEL